MYLICLQQLRTTTSELNRLAAELNLKYAYRYLIGIELTERKRVQTTTDNR